jgi:4-amino-4-deoxy-L-arabinose transferase-like glycosyltransferase
MDIPNKAFYTSWKPAKIFMYLLVGAIIFHIVCVVILASVPPVSRDALTHHLAIPKLYIQKGGMVELPEIPHSYYPPNLNLLYIIPLYFGNDIMPKYIHFAFALMTAWLIFSYIKKRLDGLYALTGVLFFLSIPVIVKLSITVYVDLGLAFFSFAALVALIRWYESGFSIRYLICSGVLCGLALGTKYNGLLVLFIMTLITAFIYTRLAPAGKAQQVGALKYAAVFMLVSLLIFSPWMVRNYIWTGNPIYPLYHKWFKPSVAAVSPNQGADLHKSKTQAPAASKPAINQAGPQQSSVPWNHLSIRRIIYGESWLQIALIPVRIFFQGRDDTPKYFDGKLNPFLFILPFFAFYRIREDSGNVRIAKWLLLAFTLLFITIAFLRYSIRIRYIAPAIPALVVLSMFGLNRLTVLIQKYQGDQIKKVANVAAVAVVITSLGLNLGYLVQQFKVVDPFSYISGRCDRDAYITKYRPAYPVIKYVNEKFGEEVKILSLFQGNRRYYSDRETVHNENILRKAAKSASTPQAISFRLKKKGFTHLIVRYNLYKQWAIANFNAQEINMLNIFFNNHAQLLFSNNSYALYQI